MVTPTGGRRETQVISEVKVAQAQTTVSLPSVTLNNLAAEEGTSNEERKLRHPFTPYLNLELVITMARDRQPALYPAQKSLLK